MRKKQTRSGSRRSKSDDGCRCKAGRTFVGLVKYAIVLGPKVMAEIVNKYRARIEIPLVIDRAETVAPKGYVREDFYIEETVHARFRNLCAACEATVHVLLNCIGLHFLEELSPLEQRWISGWWSKLAI